MTGVIDIAESHQDKETWFSVKRFRIGNTRFERPLKTLDARGLTESAYGKAPRAALRWPRRPGRYGASRRSPP